MSAAQRRRLQSVNKQAIYNKRITVHVRPSSGTAVYPHMPILRVANALDESASASQLASALDGQPTRVARALAARPISASGELRGEA